MSHNPKRLPKRLRERHIREREKSGCKTGAVGKRPSRKYRRRPRNLLDEYNRRQKKFVWLETHIWHAKRFHMVNRWGYKIAEHPNDKSARSCYRASSKRCLMTVIHVIRSKEQLVTNSSTRLTQCPSVRAYAYVCPPTFQTSAMPN